jgi:hypothetical protein
MAPRTLALTLALTLAITVSALAAGPLKGKTYKGTTPKFGTSLEHHKTAVPSHTISLKVSSNGKKVSVHLSFGHPILFCQTKSEVHVEETTPAKISGNGSFKATIAERFQKSVGGAPVTQVVTGRFSGHNVTGTIRTEAENEKFCEGTVAFSAHA